MHRTFEGFLLSYCRELTGLQTASIKRFATAVVSDSPSAAEPLLLLALVQGRSEYLLRCVSDHALQGRYLEFLETFRSSRAGLEPYLESLPPGNRYAKVLLSYRSEQGRLERDRRTLKGVAARMVSLIEEKGLTRAQACARLGLNKGNFYAFLTGDPSRLSRETAMGAFREIMSW